MFSRASKWVYHLSWQNTLSWEDNIKTFTRAEMRELDRRSIEDIGIPGIILMENAGKSASLFFRELLLKKDNRYRPFEDFRDNQNDLEGYAALILCGRGNNGGDGHVIARHFHNWGARVKVLLLANENELRPGGDAEINFKIIKTMGLDISCISDEESMGSFDFAGYDAIIDGLYGTGLERELKGISKLAVEKANQQDNCLKFAIDIPSGLDSDNGEIHGVCFKADATATFGGAKTGMSNKELTGEIRVIDISAPRELYQP
jgi:hydroxyethylthiazole kinase-like uncharacterized protein yjeF